MGRYADKSDIEDVFGVDNVATWSNLDNDQAEENEDRIEAAIARAEAVIDDRFRGGRYAVPLQGSSGVPSVVRGWTARLAGIALCESRGLAGAMGESLVQMRREIEREIQEYLSGRRRLDAFLAADSPDGPVVIP